MVSMKRIILVLLVLTSAALGYSQEGLRIVDATHYWAGNLYIVGLVQNDLPFDVAFVSLGLECYNKHAELVQTESTYAATPILEGRQVPFTFIISSDEAGDIDRYRIVINDFTQTERGTFDFIVDNLNVTERNNTFHKYSGKVRSMSDMMRKFVSVNMVAYGSDGRLVYVASTYPQKSNLPPNGESVVEFLIPPERSWLIVRYWCYAYSD